MHDRSDERSHVYDNRETHGHAVPAGAGGRTLQRQRQPDRDRRTQDRDGRLLDGQDAGLGSDGRVHRPDEPAQARGRSYERRDPAAAATTTAVGRRTRAAPLLGKRADAGVWARRGPTRPRADERARTEERRPACRLWPQRRRRRYGRRPDSGRPTYSGRRGGYASREAYDRDERIEQPPASRDYDHGHYEPGSALAAASRGGGGGGGDDGRPRTAAEDYDDDDDEPAGGGSGKDLRMKINDGAPPARPNLPHPKPIVSLAGGAAPPAAAADVRRSNDRRRLPGLRRRREAGRRRRPADHRLR